MFARSGNALALCRHDGRVEKMMKNNTRTCSVHACRSRTIHARRARVCRDSSSKYVAARSPLPSVLSRFESIRVQAASAVAAAEAVKVGDKFPSDVSLSYFDADGAMQTVQSEQLTADKKVVLFAVPGAFTPTCSLKHLPGFIEKAAEIKSKGVDIVACVAVNDAFVMDAWGKSVQADGEVMMIADGSALLAKKLGVELDLNDKGLGMRSRRYVMLIDNGTITHLNLEEGGAFTFSSADDILKIL